MLYLGQIDSALGADFKEMAVEDYDIDDDVIKNINKDVYKLLQKEIPKMAKKYLK